MPPVTKVIKLVPSDLKRNCRNHSIAPYYISNRPMVFIAHQLLRRLLRVTAPNTSPN
jgi:hypothetical protein